MGANDTIGKAHMSGKFGLTVQQVVTSSLF